MRMSHEAVRAVGARLGGAEILDLGPANASAEGLEGAGPRASFS